MQQALEAIQFDEFEKAPVAPLPVKRTIAFDMAENVVRPAFPPRSVPSAQKPELSAALDAIGQAGDLIKAAGDRAARAEEQHRLLTERTDVMLQDAQDEIEALRARAEQAESRLAAVTERAAERLSDAAAELRAAQDETRVQADRAEAAERACDEGRIQCQLIVKDANDRIFAAETRTIEAKEDLVYLENTIRERFAFG